MIDEYNVPKKILDIAFSIEEEKARIKMNISYVYTKKGIKPCDNSKKKFHRYLKRYRV